MTCDLCRHGAVCRYRDEYEHAFDTFIGARAIAAEKVGELPAFVELNVTLTCRNFEAYGVPNQFPGYNGFGPPTPIPCIMHPHNISEDIFYETYER